MKSLHESLLDDEDDVIDKVNTKPLVEKWCKENNITNYRLQEDENGLFIINVKGSIMFYGYKEEELPSYIQFGRVTGKLSAYKSNFTTLRGFPKSVGIIFLVECNELKSLEYFPKEVTGKIHLSNLNIESLEGLPKKTKDLSIQECHKLQNLKGCPSYIPDAVYIHSCSELKSLQGLPDSTIILGLSNLPNITSLNGISKRVTKLKINNLGKDFTSEEIKKHCLYKFKGPF